MIGKKFNVHIQLHPTFQDHQSCYQGEPNLSMNLQKAQGLPPLFEGKKKDRQNIMEINEMNTANIIFNAT